MRKNLLKVSLAACCAIVLSSSVALAGDNWLGTWNLDLAKSKYSPGPAPKSLTLKFEATPAGIKLTTDGEAPTERQLRAVRVQVRRQGRRVGGQPGRRHGLAEEDRRQQLREHLEEGRQGDRRREGRGLTNTARPLTGPPDRDGRQGQAVTTRTSTTSSRSARAAGPAGLFPPAAAAPPRNLRFLRRSEIGADLRASQAR